METHLTSTLLTSPPESLISAVFGTSLTLQFRQILYSTKDEGGHLMKDKPATVVISTYHWTPCEHFAAVSISPQYVLKEMLISLHPTPSHTQESTSISPLWNGDELSQNPLISCLFLFYIPRLHLIRETSHEHILYQTRTLHYLFHLRRVHNCSTKLHNDRHSLTFLLSANPSVLFNLVTLHP